MKRSTPMRRNIGAKVQYYRKQMGLTQKELAARSKKLGQVDVRYQKLVERLVCEEFAAALGATPDSMKGRLYAAMEQKPA